jgi:hypothetical protein
MGIIVKEYKGRFIYVASITRGKGALEGVTSSIYDVLGTRLLSDFLLSSKHLGQVRVIVYKSLEGVNPWLLSKNLGKPVLEVVPESDFDKLTTVRFGCIVVKPVGINGASALRVLKEVTSDNRIPAIELTEKIVNSLP